jgi:hypothetical protein
VEVLPVVLLLVEPVSFVARQEVSNEAFAEPKLLLAVSALWELALCSLTVLLLVFGHACEETWLYVIRAWRYVRPVYPPVHLPV